METLSPRRPRIVRLAFLVAVVAANVSFVQRISPAPYLGVIPAMRLAAAVTLWAALYVGVYSLWKGQCTLPAAVKEVPAMNLQSVLAYIYGLGLVVFTTILAGLGVSSAATLNFVCGMTAVCVSDAMERVHEPWFRRAVGVLSGVCAAVAIHFVANSEPRFRDYAAAIEAGDSVNLAYGLAIPLAAPFAFYLTRGHSYCSPALVCELIGVAFPFAGLLSALILCTLSPDPGVPEHLVGPPALVPLLCLPVLFFGVQTALLFSTAEFLCALALVLSAKHFVVNGEQVPDALLALCFGGIAFLLRLCACLHRDDVEGRDMCGTGTEKKCALLSGRGETKSDEGPNDV